MIKKRVSTKTQKVKENIPKEKELRIEIQEMRQPTWLQGEEVRILVECEWGARMGLRTNILLCYIFRESYLHGFSACHINLLQSCHDYFPAYAKCTDIEKKFHISEELKDMQSEGYLTLKRIDDNNYLCGLKLSADLQLKQP